MQCDDVWFPEESEVRQMSLSDVIGEHLCLYWFAKTSCLDFGFEGLDLVTIRRKVLRRVHLGLEGIDSRISGKAAELQAQFRGLQAFTADLIVFL